MWCDNRTNLNATVKFLFWIRRVICKVLFVSIPSTVEAEFAMDVTLLRLFTCNYV